MYQSYALTPVRPQERFDYFASLVDQVFCPMHCNPRDAPEQFAARVETADYGNICIARVSTSPITVSRRFRDVARIPDPPYLVKFQLRGESRWSQCGPGLAATVIADGNYVNVNILGAGLFLLSLALILPPVLSYVRQPAVA